MLLRKNTHHLFMCDMRYSMNILNIWGRGRRWQLRKGGPDPPCPLDPSFVLCSPFHKKILGRAQVTADTIIIKVSAFKLEEKNKISDLPLRIVSESSCKKPDSAVGTWCLSPKLSQWPQEAVIPDDLTEVKTETCTLCDLDETEAVLVL